MAVFASSAAVSAWRTRLLANDTEALTGRISAARGAAFEVEINAEELASATRAHLVTGDPASAQRASSARRELLEFAAALRATRLVATSSLDLPLRQFTAASDSLLLLDARQRGLLGEVSATLAALDSLLDDHVQRAAERELAGRPDMFEAGEEMEINVVELSGGLWEYLGAHRPAVRGEIANDRDDFTRFLTQYRQGAATPDERRWADEIARLYRRQSEQVVRILALEDRKQEAQQRFTGAEARLDSILDHRIQPEVEAHRAAIAARARRTTRQAAAWALAGLLAAGLLAVLVARATLRAVTRPLRALLAASERVRQGRFDQPIGALPTAEFSRLASSFDSMSTELAGALRDLEEARDAAEDASRRKSEFVSEVSHELRTPLTAVRAALGLLSATAGALPPASARLIEVARRNTEWLGRLIDDTLDLDRLEAGGEDLHPAALPAGAVVAAALEATRARAEERRVALRENAADLPLWAEERLVERVLINLVSNAVKYAPPGSEVVIRARAAGEGMVRFEVEDGGPGIPAAHQPRIFQRFARAGGSDDPGGTGLGLALARAIVEQHGGRIGFESVPGRTLFWFTVPAPASVTA